MDSRIRVKVPYSIINRRIKGPSKIPSSDQNRYLGLLNKHKITFSEHISHNETWKVTFLPNFDQKRPYLTYF